MFKPEKPKGNVIAKAGNSYLYPVDIESFTKTLIGNKDSANQVHQYITAWANDRIFSQYADKELPSQLKDFSAQIEAYKTDLLINTYENYINSKDLKYDEPQLIAFYNRYPDMFRLLENLYQVRYAVFLPGKKAQVLPLNVNVKVTKQYQKLENWLFQSAIQYQMNDSIWISERQLRTILPKSENDISLIPGKQVVLQDSTKQVVIWVKNKRNSGELAPYNWVRSDLIKMLNAKLSKERIEQIRKQLFNEAKNNKTFEIY